MILGPVLIFVVAALAGAWSLLLGVLIGMNPVTVYLAAVAGSVTMTSLALFAGGAVRDWLVSRFQPKTLEKVRDGRASHLLSKWGEPGLAVVGGIIMGPTVTVAAALLLDLDRRRFARWYIGATIILFALITMLWDLVFN